MAEYVFISILTFLFGLPLLKGVFFFGAQAFPRDFPSDKLKVMHLIWVLIASCIPILNVGLVVIELLFFWVCFLAYLTQAKADFLNKDFW